MALLKSKKGQEEGGGGFSTAIWLVILVVGILIFILFIYKNVALAGQLSEDTACYTTLIGSMLSSEELVAKCPVQEYVVQNNALKESKGGKLADSDIVKDFSASDNKVNELFTKAMGKCLQRGGGVSSKAFGRSWFGSNTVCLECSNIRFDKDVAKNSFSELRYYLENTNAPNQNKKFADIFSKDQGHKEDWINYGYNDNHNLLPGKYEQSIEKNNIYTVFFIGIKESTASAVALNWRVLGREDVYFVYAATQEDSTKICDRKVN